MTLGLPWAYTELYKTGDQKAEVAPVLERLAKERLIAAGAFTDSAVDTYKGFSGMSYTTVKAEKTDGGFRVNGRHSFGTSSPALDFFSSTAVYDDPDEGEVALLFMVPMDTPGLVLQNDWNTMGMRHTGSHSMVFDNAFVPDEVAFRHPTWEWGQFERLILSYHGGTFSTVYLGIARAARDFAINYTKDRTRLPFNHPESYYPGNQFLAAEMDISLKAAWAWQLSIAERLTDPYARDDDTITDAIAMQYFCMHTAVDVVNKAFEMVGGAALAKRLPLERYYRDVRAGPIHPIGGYGALEVIGKRAYGLPRDVEPRYV
jgi:alkylation response protein AidB-like acyl-CoA dehydrogenase